VNTLKTYDRSSRPGRDLCLHAKLVKDLDGVARSTASLTHDRSSLLRMVDDARDGLPRDCEVSRDILLAVSLTHRNYGYVASEESFPFSNRSASTLDTGHRRLVLYDEVRQHLVQEIQRVRVTADSPMVLRLPILIHVIDALNDAEAKAFVDADDHIEVSVRNTHINAIAIGQIDASLAIEEAGQPGDELCVAPGVKHSNLRVSDYNAGRWLGHPESLHPEVAA